MELITYPFSLFMGGVFVLFLTLPIVWLAYRGVQLWCKWATDSKFIMKTAVDRWLEHPDLWHRKRGRLNPIIGKPLGLGGILALMICLGSLVHGNLTQASVLETLITLSFATPVKVVAFLSPILFPAVVLFGASFGMRKLFRAGYNISDRLAKVETKE